MALNVFYPRVKPDLYPREVDVQAWDLLQNSLDPSVNLTAQEELPDPADYHILVAGRPTQEQMDASPNLHTLVIPWAGLPEATRDLMTSYPHIAVHNLHHNAIPTAETALMLLLTAAKHILPMDRKFRQHDWRPRYGPNPALMLHGKTALILGFGRIGQHLARVCQAIGMTILAVRSDPAAPIPEGLQAEVHSPAALHDLLPRAEALLVTLPLTDQTRGLIGPAEISLLPENAIVVNIGRGAIIDQQALYQALEAGKLHSAGIDVWYNYPPDEASRANTPPADYPFHQLDNVVMSPHRGGGAVEVETLRMTDLADLLNAAARGEPMPNQINLERGY